MNDLLSALGHAAVYAAAASVLLVVAYYVLDVVTPGHLGTHLRGTDETASSSAGRRSRTKTSSARSTTAAWTTSTSRIGHG